mmetsp:Transcript_30588/g.79433  ORF Transcript_30588/g.79433 Transcript_30588/m.79433 type:complete len:209 (+) Transcript_30588:1694-2320(+)
MKPLCKLRHTQTLRRCHHQVPHVYPLLPGRVPCCPSAAELSAHHTSSNLTLRRLDTLCALLLERISCLCLRVSCAAFELPNLSQEQFTLLRRFLEFPLALVHDALELPVQRLASRHKLQVMCLCFRLLAQPDVILPCLEAHCEVGCLKLVCGSSHPRKRVEASFPCFNPSVPAMCHSLVHQSPGPLCLHFLNSIFFGLLLPELVALLC